MKFILITLIMVGLCLLPAAAAEGETASETEISVDTEAISLDLSEHTEDVTITEAGTYRLTGSLSGQVTVDADGEVTLLLAGVSLTGEECLLLKGDYPVTVITEAGTVNTLSDGYSEPNSHVSAAVVSKCPLTLTGDGLLVVNAGGNNGIQCKDGLSVTGGTVQLNAANNGLKTEGALTVSGGSLTLTCGGDGLCAESSRLADGDISVSGGSIVISANERGMDAEGGITVSDGIVNIISKEDGIRAEGSITLSGGEVLVTVREEVEETPADETEIVVETEPVTGDGLQAGAVTVSGGSLVVNASDEGIQADLSVALAGGKLDITSAGNGISSDGSVIIGEAALTLVSQADAIQGTQSVTVTGGTLNITTGEGGGQAINRSDEGSGMGPGGFGGGRSSSYTMPDESMKGFKSDGDITVTGGTIVLNCVDDAIHAGGSVILADMDMTVTANDDAVHADENVTIESGRLLVLDCFEGIEGKIITVNGGDTDVYSVNDGINATSGSDGFGGGPGGFGGFGGGTDCAFIMNGGSVDIYITGSSSNLGDGVDSNGSLTVNGGWLTSSTVGGTMENGLDSGGSFVVNGGIVASGGNSGMQESASSSSSQCTAVLSISSYVAAGVECVVTDAEGSELIRWTPYNGCNCLIFSHPDFQIGSTYTLTYGDKTLDFTFDSVSYSNSGHGGFGGFGGFRF